MDRSKIRTVLVGLALVLCVCLPVTGCGGGVLWRVPVNPPRGLLFTTYKAPLTAEMDRTPAEGRVGTASTLYVRDPIFTGIDLAWQDASINAAAQEAGISEIYYADFEVLQILGVFGRFTTRVYGE